MACKESAHISQLLRISHSRHRPPPPEIVCSVFLEQTVAPVKNEHVLPLDPPAPPRNCLPFDASKHSREARADSTVHVWWFSYLSQGQTGGNASLWYHPSLCKVCPRIYPPVGELPPMEVVARTSFLFQVERTLTSRNAVSRWEKSRPLKLNARGWQRVWKRSCDSQTAASGYKLELEWN